MSEKKPTTGGSADTPSSRKDRGADALAETFFKRLQSDSALTQESQEILNAALKAMQRPSVETDTRTGLQDMALETQRQSVPGLCDICGHQNRPGNQFCGMCGLPMPDYAGPVAEGAGAESAAPGSHAPAASPRGHAPGHHFYHHHYHHHYFPSGADVGAAASSSIAPRVTNAEATRDPSRVRTPGSGQPMSRAETSARKLMQDWALACNTKHLDDLVDIYASDAMVLRPNHPPVRGTAAIREFFVATLDAGFGEAELDPVRLEVIGDIAYEAGRCKALVPIAVSKRREERGKYLTILARQSNGEWKIITDCWSSDLALSVGEAEGTKGTSSVGTPVKPGIPRKNP